MSDVLPAELERADGTTVTEAVLAGKIVMLFFSAEWCPACTTFVPVLCASL
jgi:peroxiredoxin